MALKFYLPSSGAAANTPVVKGTYTDSSQADLLAAVTARISSAFGNKSVNVAEGGGNAYYLIRRYLSEPIKAITLTASVDHFDLSMRCVAGAANVNASLLFDLSFVSADGTVNRGSFFSGRPNVVEWATSLASRFADDKLVTVTRSAEEGDRVLIEIACQASAPAAGTAAINFGDNSATELDLSDADTDEDTPWIQFNSDMQLVEEEGADIELPLTGVSGTASVGSLVLGLAMLLATVVGTGGIGTISPPDTFPVSGIEVLGEVGTVTPQFGVGGDITIPITGVSANPAYQLSGVAATGAVGTVTPVETGDIILPITGVSGTGSVGDVVYLTLGGWAATGEIGDVAPTVAPPLTGVEATAAVGSVGQDRTAGLTGTSANGIAGGWSGFSRPLTGVAGTGALGTPSPDHSAAITGVAGAGRIGASADTHLGVGFSVTPTGVVGAGVAGHVDHFVAGDLVLPLTGITVTASVGTVTCGTASPQYIHVKPRKRILNVQPRHRIITVSRRRF
ncbi:MAG TPA: hypothetical protein VNA25_25875 [Phycisphaerae bacterium]|nr:hypothetical protein [Phycisphaerae bacterium]